MKHPHALPLLLISLCTAAAGGCASAGSIAAGVAKEVAKEVAFATLKAAMAPGAPREPHSPTCQDACYDGTICDEKTGMCVPEQVRTMADYDVVSEDAAGDVDHAPAKRSKAARARVQQPPPDDESCGGFCLASEICRVRIGDDVECVARPRAR